MIRVEAVFNVTFKLAGSLQDWKRR